MNYTICKNTLDKEQQKIAEACDKYILVVAGAGSGKTLTIIGKIYNLINIKKINYKDILCISFTKASSLSLKEKLKLEFNKDIDVYTFHKLSLNILSLEKKKYEIANEDTLLNIIHEYLYVDILNNEYMIKNILYYFNIKENKNIKEKYLSLIQDDKKFNLFINLLFTFIKLFKCNNYNIIDFKLFLKKIKKTINFKKYKKEKIFLVIILNIYLNYQKYLNENNLIDFDDMIIYATKFIKNYKRKLNYKYIIIDEYQDTSFIRFNLIKEIINNTSSSLMVVGDDFQSIYKFTGCNIGLFINFKKFFKDASIYKIETTYRNSQELIKIAGDFVMKNKFQIKKNLKSNKHLNKPIKIIYYKNFIESFIKIIEEIYIKYKEKILILGRNNNDINMIINSNYFYKENNRIIYKNNKEIYMYFMTVHKSKGLEEKNIILINVNNNILGFPNKIKDDKMLRLVNPSHEKIEFAEERRLFYVAITRTENYCYIMCKKNNESIFVKELVKKHKKYLSIINL